MGDWWIDETPPKDPPERAPFIMDASITRILVNAFIDFNKLAYKASKSEYVFIISALGKPRPVILPKKPYLNDPPTNLIYPTSFDSWYQEYDRPVRRSQTQVSKRLNSSRR